MKPGVMGKSRRALPVVVFVAAGCALLTQAPDATGVRVMTFAFPSLPELVDPAGAPVMLRLTAERAGGAPFSRPRAFPLREGGFSGLARVRDPASPSGFRQDEFWVVTDRGPNADISQRADRHGEAFGDGAKYFPFPGYNQSIFRLHLQPDRTIRIADRIRLKRSGQPVNGLPSSAPFRGGDETAYADPYEKTPGSRIEPSSLGYDFEGIFEDVPEADGGRAFWTCDEYGPSVQLFDALGNLLWEFIPGARASGRGTPGEPAVFPLPAVLKHRKYNRGFEGLTGTREGIFAILQSPFDPAGGTSGQAGNGNPSSRLHRLLRIEKGTWRATMFPYDHLDDPGRFGVAHEDVKLGDLAALDENGRSFLVYEQATKPDLTLAFAHLYRISITESTTVLLEEKGVDYEAGRAAYVALEKVLVIDLTERLRVLPVPGSGEGLAVVDPGTFLLLFDNDYGFDSDYREVFPLPDVVSRTVLLEFNCGQG